MATHAREQYGDNRSPVVSRGIDVPMRAALKNTPSMLRVSRVYVPFPVAVHERRRRRADIGAGADDQQHHEEERLEVKERRLV